VVAKTRSALFVLLLLFLPPTCWAELDIVWNKSYEEIPRIGSIVQSDGGLLVATWEAAQIVFLRIDGSGNAVWSTAHEFRTLGHSIEEGDPDGWCWGE